MAEDKAACRPAVGRRIGKSITLTQKNASSDHKPVYYVNNGIPEVVRQGEWKLRRTVISNGNKQEKIELFDLKHDPGERSNLADRYPDVTQKMLRLLDQYPDKK